MAQRDDTQSAIKISNLEFAWCDQRVIKDLSLEVPHRSVVCLMGTNGCGKSTLIDCVLGENKPQAGIIELCGERVETLSVAKRARLLAFVPQKHGRTFPFTVRQIIAMGRTAYRGATGARAVDEDELVDTVMRKCRISHLAERPVTMLSGGEVQMALLARALVQDAPILVLDEPTAHLDFKNELLFLETIEHLAAQEGKTVLMATHSPNQAFHLAQAGLDVHVALMSDGRIVEMGPPDDVLDEGAFRSYFGIEAVVAQATLDAAKSKMLRQIIPVASIVSEESE